MLTLHKVYPTLVYAAMLRGSDIDFFPEVFENYPGNELDDALWVDDLADTVEVSGTLVSLAEKQQSIAYACGTPLRVFPYDFAVFTVDTDKNDQLYILADQWEDA